MQMWRAWASPGADVAGASSVPVQMWLGRVQSVFKCGLMTAGSVPRSPGVRQVEFSIATSTAKKSLKRATRITLIERAVVKREQVRPTALCACTLLQRYPSTVVHVYTSRRAAEKRQQTAVPEGALRRLS